MAGTKRSAPDSSSAVEERQTRAKSAKTDSSPKSKGKPQSKAAKKGKGPKAPAFSAFKAKALPLHVNFTHTPPVISEGDDKVTTASADPGSLGNATLVPSQFNTGSYGWKGSKRVTVEIPNPDGGEGEKVQVMISINATVMGSKGTKGGEETKGTQAEEKGEEKEEGGE